MTAVDDALTAPITTSDGSAFVAFSELTVPDEGRTALVEAFQARLGAVDSAPGFQRLEVWADADDPSAFTMVTWWDSKAAFLAYMRSADHRTSHARVPTGAGAPHAARFRRFERVAT